MPDRVDVVAADPRWPDQAARVHLHVVDAATWPERPQRLLRDHLRAHPASAQRYGALKRRLAGDPDGYTAGKTALIQELVDAERARRGLPTSAVWEE